MAGLMRVPAAHPGFTLGGSPVGELAESGTGRKAIPTLAQIGPLKVDAVQPRRTYGKQHAGMSGTGSPEGIDSKYAAVIKAVARYWMPRAVPFGCAWNCPTASVVLRAGCAVRRSSPS